MYVDQGAVRLILDRRFKSPLVFTTPYFDFLIAILNNDAVDFVSIKTDDILGLSPRLLRAWPLHFKEPEVSDASDHNDRQDKGIPPVHPKRVVATTLRFR